MPRNLDVGSRKAAASKPTKQEKKLENDLDRSSSCYHVDIPYLKPGDEVVEAKDLG